MNKNQRNGLFAVLTVVSMAAVATLAVYANKGETALNPVQATDNSVTINKTQFAGIQLSDIEISGGTNKAFRYSLGGEKYVDGWILYSDCGHQSIVDQNGKRYFVMDNSEESEENNLNFNIVFNFKGITDVSFGYNYTLSNPYGYDLPTSFAGVKYSARGDQGFDPRGYEIHQLTNYWTDPIGGEDPEPDPGMDPEEPEPDPGEGGGDEGAELAVSTSGLITRHSETLQPVWECAENPDSFFMQGTHSDGYASSIDPEFDGHFSLCSINFAIEGIPEGAVVQIEMTSMTFTYTC